jgi:uncharacterized radical SAM superfamily Fe-S cluster-containing enzyme
VSGNRRDKDYIFHASTTSLCPECMETVPAKIVIEGGSVYLLKRCPVHGEQTCLLEEDAALYLTQSEYEKPGTEFRAQTRVADGCPRDCGLCPDHEQHTCIAVIDVTGACDLSCPTCFASSGSGTPLAPDTFERMLDFIVEAEGGDLEILQVSGGEPTTHPAILDLLRIARRKRIGHVMLNTNGLRIAEDASFADELGRFKGCFEVYLQFDGFKGSTHQRLRGADLLDVKRKALRALTDREVPVTLVAAIEKGTNEDEIGSLIDFGIRTKFVRGINFQSLAYFGRFERADPLSRITLTGILRRIESQTGGRIKASDVVPLPCHPDRMALTFLVREGEDMVPLTRKVDVRKNLSTLENTICFKPPDMLRAALRRLWSASTVLSSAKSLKDFACCLPLDTRLLSSGGREDFVNGDTFRISVASFVDAWNFDVASLKRECVHVVTPDLRRIPFSAYNMFHRQRTAETAAKEDPHAR